MTCAECGREIAPGDWSMELSGGRVFCEFCMEHIENCLCADVEDWREPDDGELVG